MYSAALQSPVRGLRERARVAKEKAEEKRMEAQRLAEEKRREEQMQAEADRARVQALNAAYSHLEGRLGK